MDPSKDWFLRSMSVLSQRLETTSGRDIAGIPRPKIKRQTATEMPVPDNSLGDDELLPEILDALIDSGKLDEAENLLFRCVENYPLAENYDLGLRFYESLSYLSREELRRNGWSPEEIREGLFDLYRLIFEEDPPKDALKKLNDQGEI